MNHFCGTRAHTVQDIERVQEKLSQNQVLPDETDPGFSPNEVSNPLASFSDDELIAAINIETHKSYTAEITDTPMFHLMKEGWRRAEDEGSRKLRNLLTTIMSSEPLRG